MPMPDDFRGIQLTSDYHRDGRLDRPLLIR